LIKIVALEEVLRVDHTECSSGTSSWKGWEPLFYSIPATKWKCRYGQYCSSKQRGRENH